MCYLLEWSVEPAWFEATVDNAVCTCISIAAPPPSAPQELKASPTVAPLLLSQIAAYEENHFNVAALVGTLALFLITYLLYVHQPSECSVHDIVHVAMARLYQAFPSSPLYCVLPHSCLLPPSLPLRWRTLRPSQLLWPLWRPCTTRWRR